MGESIEIKTEGITTALIKADIEICNRIYYGEEQKNADVQKSLMNLAGFHASQAVEKSLKLMIYNTSKIENESLKTHSISKLFDMICKLREDFHDSHKELEFNQTQLSWLNELRYNKGKDISKDDVAIAISIANKLHKELEVDRKLTKSLNDGQRHYNKLESNQSKFVKKLSLRKKEDDYHPDGKENLGDITTALIKADIEVCKMVHYGEEHKSVFVQRMLQNLSGFHASQAVEKALKLMLYNMGCEEIKSHSILTLVDKMSELRESFKDAHIELELNKHQLSWVNNIRYGKVMNVSKDDVNIALGLAQQLHKELEADRGLTNYINDGKKHFKEYDKEKNNNHVRVMTWRGEY